MRVLIVSDIHLGSPSRLADADQKLIELLGKDNWNKVIFLGDLFDLWVATYEEIVKAHSDVLSAIEQLSCEVIYVPGNHDAVFRGLERLNSMTVVAEPYVFYDGGKKIALFHGDRFEDAIGMSFLSRLLAVIGAWIDRCICWNAKSGFSIQRTVRYSLAQSGQAGNYATSIANKATKVIQADIVLIGHTHLIDGPRTVNESIYVNTGDFGPEHFTWVEITDGDLVASWGYRDRTQIA